MTKKDDKSKSSEEDGVNKEVADKLKTMGVMPSDDPADAKPDNVSKGSYYPLIMAVMFAAVIAVIVYFFSGKDLNVDLTDLGSDLGVSDFFASDASNQNSPALVAPTAPSTQPTFAAGNPSTEPDWMTARREAMQNRTETQQANRDSQPKWTPPETPEWVQEQRNKMKEQMAQRSADNVSGNREWTPPEPPAWAKEQQALRQKQLAQRPDWANRNTNRSQVEPPAWVKERQAMREKQRPQRPDWANREPGTAPPQLPTWVKERQSQMMGQRPDWARPPQWQQQPPAPTSSPQMQQPGGPVYYPPAAPAYGYYGPVPYPYYGPRY
ncbi:MAG: hypothetical protein OQL06_03330 [Gammaproteobacteria bacterium]|nr:hypothetical protein [Gammaproteobacteria bacterium]